MGSQFSSAAECFGGKETNVVKPKLVPVDKKQCQAEKPNGYSFMTLGGVPGRARCTNVPSAIITETKPGKDGQLGSMSLCQACWLVAAQQLGPDAFTSRHVDAPRGGKQGRK